MPTNKDKEKHERDSMDAIENKITGVRLEPELRLGLERVAVRLNLESPYATITPAGLIRGLVRKFLVDEGEIAGPGKPRKV